MRFPSGSFSFLPKSHCFSQPDPQALDLNCFAASSLRLSPHYGILHHLIHHAHQLITDGFGLRLSIIKGGSLNAIVEFDLRLSSGRTDAEPCAVVHIIVKNIGLRKTCLLYFARRNLCDRVLLVVTDRSYLVTAKCLRRVLAEVLHNFLDLRKSLNSF